MDASFSDVVAVLLHAVFQFEFLCVLLQLLHNQSLLK